MKRIQRLLNVWVALLVFFASFASAQMDERARELIAGLVVPSEEAIRTLDQVMVVEVEGMQVRTRTLIDFVNERARIETEAMPGMQMVMLLLDGRVQMSVGGMTMPAMPGMADAYDDLFAADPNDPFAGIERARYDGVQSYGNLVSGEQITLWGATAMVGLESGNDEVKMIFDAAGRLAAVLTDSDEGMLLMVYDPPFRGSLALGFDAVLYQQQGGTFRRFSSVRFEDVRINEPFDATLFTAP